MSAANPLLDMPSLPAFSRIKPTHLVAAINQALADYQATIDTITALDEPASFNNTMLPQEAMEVKLTRAFSPASHLHAVANTPELRKAYAETLEKLTEFSSQMGQNRALYTKVKEAQTHATDADADQQAAMRHAVRDFKLSGVALDEPERSRFRAISHELSKLSTEFSNAVLDATDAWQLHLEDDLRLGGVPPSGRDTLRAYAREKKLNGYLITLQQPAIHAILTYADDRALRQEVYRAYQTRASDQGPDAGKYDNSERIERIMALRDEAAKLLGFANAAESSLATKMANSTEEVMAFLDQLVERAKPVAEKEFAELQQFAAQELDIHDFEAWDSAYASEHLRRKHYALDEEQLKPYFSVANVIEGLFNLVGKLYGIRLCRNPNVDVWHPNVQYFEVYDAHEQLIAGLYMDLYARTGKRGGAWMDVCQPRFVHGQTKKLPIAYLTTNFAPPGEVTPALMSHDDVLTLFHEFGHCLHHLLTEVNMPSVGGIDGVEWDAVEMPSQFMENFAWDYATLQSFAKHYKTGETLPEELFKRMQKARYFHAGMFLVRQLEFALFDFRLHLEYDPDKGARTLETLDQVRQQVAVNIPPKWNRFAHAFGHIFAGGYAAGYYSYLWAEVLSADIFSRFAEHTDVVDPTCGAAFRQEILARGATRPTMQNFIAFRGRKPSIDALLASYGMSQD